MPSRMPRIRSSPSLFSFGIFETDEQDASSSSSSSFAVSKKEKEKETSTTNQSSISSSSCKKSLLSQYENLRTGEKKSLEFGMIEIFEFPIQIGDNPHVSSGCPIALDWEAELRTIQPLDNYEQIKNSKKQRLQLLEKSKRKSTTSQADGVTTSIKKKKSTTSSRDQLKLSVSERAQLLLGAGFSIHEIAQATMEAETMKRLRAETNRQQKWDGIHAMMEVTGRNLRKLLLMGNGNGNGIGTEYHRSNSNTSLMTMVMSSS